MRLVTVQASAGQWVQIDDVHDTRPFHISIGPDRAGAYFERIVDFRGAEGLRVMRRCPALTPGTYQVIFHGADTTAPVGHVTIV